MARRIHLVIDLEGAEATTHTADDYQAAATWLLTELGRDSGTSYPPVGNEDALNGLVEAIDDKLGTSGVSVTWQYAE